MTKQERSESVARFAKWAKKEWPTPTQSTAKKLDFEHDHEEISNKEWFEDQLAISERISNE